MNEMHLERPKKVVVKETLTDFARIEILFDDEVVSEKYGSSELLWTWKEGFLEALRTVWEGIKIEEVIIQEDF